MHSIKYLVFLVLGVLIMGGADVANASPRPLEGMWTFTLDFSLDDAVTPVRSYDVRFESSLSSFVGRSVQSNGETMIFEGDLFQDGEANHPFRTIVFVQYGYRRVFRGLRIDRTTIVGTWQDVRGQSGNFRMVRKPEKQTPQPLT